MLLSHMCLCGKTCQKLTPYWENCLSPNRILNLRQIFYCIYLWGHFSHCETVFHFSLAMWMVVPPKCFVAQGIFSSLHHAMVASFNIFSNEHVKSSLSFWVSLLNCKSLLQPSSTEWNPGLDWVGGRCTELNRVMASPHECINFIFIYNSKTNNDLLCLKVVMAPFIIFKYLNSFGWSRCEVLFLILKGIS